MSNSVAELEAELDRLHKRRADLEKKYKRMKKWFAVQMFFFDHIALPLLKLFGVLLPLLLIMGLMWLANLLKGGF